MDKCNLNLKKYIGTKVVEARPMNEIDAEYIGYARKNSDNHEWRDGYHVRYTNPDGSFYDSWSPKDVFEKAYREVKGMSFGEVIEPMKLITDLQKEENMTREEANKALPTLQAFAEGKVIQMLDDRSIWTDLEGLPIGTLGESPNIFRIKPEPKYRPFKNADECWAEMKIHRPFGWVKEKERNVRAEINYIHNEGVMFSCGSVLFERLFDVYTFVDGTPFGIKLEE